MAQNTPAPTPDPAPGWLHRLRHSIQWRLALALALTLALATALAAALAFHSAAKEARDLQDDLLRQTAALAALSPPATWQRYAQRPELDQVDDDVRLHLLRLGDPHAHPRLPTNLPDGLQTARALDENGQPDEAWRILIHTLPGGTRLAVAQELDLREDAAAASAWRSALPLLLLAPTLWLLIALLLWRLLRPLARLAADVQHRGAHQLTPLPTADLPTEAHAFVNAINRLLLRVDHAMQAQRRFVADAAHELRTPLAALSLQAEHLDKTDLPPAARQRLANLRQGLSRASHLLTQMLGLARAQAAQPSPAQPSIPLLDGLHHALTDLLPLAQARGIDLGLDAPPELAQHPSPAPPDDLHTLLRNLLDNALRHAPAGGQVDLRARHQPPWLVLEVEDNGPGIPAEERHHVLQPFYRAPNAPPGGSGLGLPIVQALIQRLGGQLQLLPSTRFASGLLVRASLPTAEPRQKQ